MCRHVFEILRYAHAPSLWHIFSCRASKCHIAATGYKLTLSLPVTKIAEFANSVDLDEVAHDEPPHLDLHCLPSSLSILNLI